MAKYTAQEEQYEFNSAMLVCHAFSAERRSDATLPIKYYRACKSLLNWMTLNEGWSAPRQRACYFCLGKAELPLSQISNCLKWMTKNWGRKCLGKKLPPLKCTCSGAQLGTAHTAKEALNPVLQHRRWLQPSRNAGGEEFLQGHPVRPLLGRFS